MKKLTLILMMIVISTFAYAEGIDDDTVLMLHGDGDDSYAIGDGYAVFDGDVDAVQISHDNVLDVTGDLTLAVWVKPNIDFQSGLSNSKMFIDKNDGSTDVGGYSLHYNKGGDLYFALQEDDGDWFSAFETINLDKDQWYFIVGTWNGTHQMLYVDGTEVASTDQTGYSTGSSTLPLYLGRSAYDAGPHYHNGKLDDAAIYNRALSPSEVTQLHDRGLQRLANNISSGRVAYYPLDIDYDDYSGSNDGTASGDVYIFNGHTVTANGDPQLSSSTKKIGSGSMYFDGSGDYLSIPDSDDWNFGSGDFTVDFWVNFDTVPGSSEWVNLITQRQSGWTDYMQFYWGYDQDFGFDMYTGGTRHVNLWSNFVPSTGTWYHVAYVRDGDDFKVYVDGLDRTRTDIGDVSYSGSVGDYSASLEIGRINDATYSKELDGYIDELRITKGQARWTSSFTPDTSPYSADANTTLLLHMDGDESDSNHTVTFNGDADLSATSKWDGSLYFDGSGDYLSIPDSDDWDFGSDDFTIDAWVKVANSYTTQHSTIVAQYDWDSSDMAWNLQKLRNSSGNNLYFTISTDGSNWFAIQSDSALSEDWNHVAVVSDGNEISLYVNGAKQTQTMSAQVINPSSNLLYIGGKDDSYPNVCNGYIDELRISKGVARWTSNFVPDTSPYSLTSGGSTPTYNNFTSTETTNFSEVADITNVTNVTLAVTGKGKIKFPESYGINAENQDFDSNIVIDDEFISVNTAALDSSFNSSATISIEGVTCPVDVITYKEGTYSSQEEIIAGGRNCILDGVCSNVVCSSGTLTFDVAHFTGFAAGGNANLTIWADSGIYYENQSVGFHASYINSTDATPLSGECNISFSDAWGTWYEMDYNGSEYNYSRNFTTAGLKNYNVSCYNSSYIELEANDSKLITSLSGDVPEFSLLTLGLGLAIILAGLFFLRRK